MSKKYIDRDIWDKKWFIDLTGSEKAAVFYLITKCDAVGVIDINQRLFDFILNDNVDIKELLPKCNGNFELLENGKILVIDYCYFQYGERILNLETGSAPIISHQKLLVKHGIQDKIFNYFKVKYNLSVSYDKVTNKLKSSDNISNNSKNIGYDKVSHNLKEKEKEKEEYKEKEKDKDKDKDCNKVKIFKTIFCKEFPDFKFNEITFEMHMIKDSRIIALNSLSEKQINKAVNNFKVCVESPDYYTAFKTPEKLIDVIDKFVDSARPFESQLDFAVAKEKRNSERFIKNEMKQIKKTSIPTDAEILEDVGF